MSLYRRLKNMQARAEQKFIYDFLPLYLLLFVSITGLALTVMNMFFAGKRSLGDVIDSSIFRYYYVNLSTVWQARSYSVSPNECVSKKLPRTLWRAIDEGM